MTHEPGVKITKECHCMYRKHDRKTTAIKMNYRQFLEVSRDFKIKLLPVCDLLDDL